MKDLLEMLFVFVGGLVGLVIIVAAPVAAICGFVAGLTYVVVKVLQTTGVL